jgi:hypothetical protein
VKISPQEFRGGVARQIIKLGDEMRASLFTFCCKIKKILCDAVSGYDTVQSQWCKLAWSSSSVALHAFRRVFSTSAWSVSVLERRWRYGGDEGLPLFRIASASAIRVMAQLPTLRHMQYNEWKSRCAEGLISIYLYLPKLRLPHSDNHVLRNLI